MHSCGNPILLQWVADPDRGVFRGGGRNLPEFEKKEGESIKNEGAWVIKKAKM